MSLDLSAFNSADVARFWGLVGDPGRLYTDDECWPWHGTPGTRGYGSFSVAGRSVAAHRVAWLLAGRRLTPGLARDHMCCSPEHCPGGATCPHRSCVNPAHLQETTLGANVLRGNGLAPTNARKTHCPRGHAYAAENIRAGRPGERGCKRCHRDRERERRRRNFVGGAA